MPLLLVVNMNSPSNTHGIVSPKFWMGLVNDWLYDKLINQGVILSNFDINSLRPSDAYMRR